MRWILGIYSEFALKMCQYQAITFVKDLDFLYSRCLCLQLGFQPCERTFLVNSIFQRGHFDGAPQSPVREAKIPKHPYRGLVISRASPRFGLAFGAAAQLFGVPITGSPVTRQ
jgi:hypothetical protein